MRLPRVRMTIRGLLVVVAISAFALMAPQSNRYRLEAEDHAFQESFLRRMRDEKLQIITVSRQNQYEIITKSDEYMKRTLASSRSAYTKMNVPPAEIDRVLAKRRAFLERNNEHLRASVKPFEEWGEHQMTSLETLIAWHSALKEKYRRAMWRPWLPVAPDPPFPDQSPEPSPLGANPAPDPPDSSEPE